MIIEEVPDFSETEITALRTLPSDIWSAAKLNGRDVFVQKANTYAIADPDCVITHRINVVDAPAATQQGLRPGGQVSAAFQEVLQKVGNNFTSARTTR